MNRLNIEQDALHCEVMGRGMAWLDTGTHESSLEASQYIEIHEWRQGFRIAYPEEIAYRQGWISMPEVEVLAGPMRKKSHGQYLRRMLIEHVFCERA